jgi:transcriptional regulator with XRE-family HTH domain
LSIRAKSCAEVGEDIRLARLALAMSQEDVARISGFTRNTISNLERGHGVSLETVLVVAATVRLDVTLHQQ